ncbi:UNVERIFIED_CONTAM: hypothetical protein K2H54_011385 [Gekko kuhli]
MRNTSEVTNHGVHLAMRQRVDERDAAVWTLDGGAGALQVCGIASELPGCLLQLEAVGGDACRYGGWRHLDARQGSSRAMRLSVSSSRLKSSGGIDKRLFICLKSTAQDL